MSIFELLMSKFKNSRQKFETILVAYNGYLRTIENEDAMTLFLSIVLINKKLYLHSLIRNCYCL